MVGCAEKQIQPRPPFSVARSGPTDAAPAAHALVVALCHLREYVSRVREYTSRRWDDTPGDGARGTFDQLYPTGHDSTGSRSVGGKNIIICEQALKRGAREARTAGVPLLLVASATDAL